MIQTQTQGESGMDIGSRLRDARTGRGLTQEAVAEAIGVSRQTISNWENNRSYPDILRVVALSDLYSISLDALLKEDKNMLHHLEESTNVVKSKRSLYRALLITAYLVIWAISVLFFWVFTDPEDALAYSIMEFFIILPVSILVIAFLIGQDESWGRWRWLTALLFGVTYMLAEYVTFSLANMTAFHKINSVELGMLVPGIGLALLGIGMGAASRSFGKRVKSKSDKT